MIKTLLILLLAPLASGMADNLKFSGVLGNSGEHGAALVRFGPQFVPGLGVVQDKFGSLWDRAGEGVLNRYAVDGRLLASYPIPKATMPSDRIAMVGDEVFFLICRRLYKLPVDAPSGMTPVDTGVQADGISTNTVDGRLGIAQEGQVLFWDPVSGGADPVWSETANGLSDFDVTPDGSVFFFADRTVRFLPKGATSLSEAVKKPWPGGRLQFLDGFWYGASWHGTIRRFNTAFEADPGVVLGGASGSFLGHVEQISEISHPTGLARLEGGGFAVSGRRGVLHLLDWNEEKKQMKAVRRIGAIPVCRGLAISSQGDVWYDGGVWKSTDRPETPQSECYGDVQAGQAVLLPNDRYVVGTVSNGAAILTGNFTWKHGSAPLKNVSTVVPPLGAAAYREENGLTLLLIDAKGQGRTFRIDRNGACQAELGPVALNPSVPVKEWTSLATRNDETLLAAADGFVLEFQREGRDWRETRRWNSWGSGPAEKFGTRLFITANARRLWVSDTARHRVLVFDLETGAFLAGCGETDRSGDSLTALNGPAMLSACGDGAVVFDSGNQRLVKLLLAR